MLEPTEELTDLENARRFARAHGEGVRWVAKWRHWLMWDGKRRREDDTGEVVRRAKELVRALYDAAMQIGDSAERKGQVARARAAQQASRISGMLELAKSEPGITVTADQLDTDAWLLNLENGTLNLRRGELRPHRREDLITKLAQVSYDPQATCPVWDSFLKRVLAGDDQLIHWVQKAVGYSLTGDAREQCLFIAYGLGANGKSTLFNTVAFVVGGYALHTPTSTLLVKKNEAIPNDLARLYGARFVTAAEAECNRDLAEALVKQLTGGDKVAARFLHGEFFEFVPNFKVFLGVNQRPSIRGTDHAIWRRIRLIPFTVTIPDEEQDKELPEKLREEKAGILRWALEGCMAWQRDGLQAPKAVTDATAEYREEMDVVGPFLDECCTRDPAAETPAGKLYEAFSDWCRTNGDRPMSKRDFGSRLTEKGFQRGRRKSARLWRGLAVTR